MSNTYNLVAGQKVFLASLKSSKKELCEANVLKVGRKYVTVVETDKEQFTHLHICFRLEDLKQDTCYSPDYRLVLDKEDYLEELKVNAAWAKIVGYFYNKYRKPAELSSESVYGIHKLLGLEVKDVENSN